jgi:hypothetical protein
MRSNEDDLLPLYLEQWVAPQNELHQYCCVALVIWLENVNFTRVLTKEILLASCSLYLSIRRYQHHHDCSLILWEKIT